MRPSLRSATALALAGVIVVTACQATPSSPAPSPSPVATPASTAQPVPSASTSTSPSASATAAAASPGQSSSGLEASEVGGRFGILPAGRYTHRGFEPRVTFEVEGPWRSVNTLEDFFDVQQQVGSPDVIAVQFARPGALLGADQVRVPATTAADAVATIRKNWGLVVVESSESRIGGLRGEQMTVENPAGTDGDRFILTVPDGPIGISPGRRLWMAFFDTPNGLLAVFVGGSVAKWDETLATAEPVLESITIGE